MSSKFIEICINYFIAINSRTFFCSSRLRFFNRAFCASDSSRRRDNLALALLSAAICSDLVRVVIAVCLVRDREYDYTSNYGGCDGGCKADSPSTPGLQAFDSFILPTDLLNQAYTAVSVQDFVYIGDARLYSV